MMMNVVDYSIKDCRHKGQQLTDLMRIHNVKGVLHHCETGEREG